MAKLTQDQAVLLRVIARMGGAANWYKVGRIALGRINTPATFTEELRWLVNTGLLVEEAIEGEELPRSSITRRGREALEGEDDDG